MRFRVEAAGLNFIDTYKRSGLYPMTLPFVVGQEAAGVVTAVGAGVADFRVGDRVATVSASCLIRTPSSPISAASGSCAS